MAMFPGAPQKTPGSLTLQPLVIGFKKKVGIGSIPIDTFFSGMNIHLPAILGFTRYQGFDPSPSDDICSAIS